MYFEILILESLTFRQIRERDVVIHLLEMRTERKVCSLLSSEKMPKILITYEISKNLFKHMKITKVNNIHQTIYFSLLILFSDFTLRKVF